MLIGTEQRIRNGRNLSIKVGETIIENVNSAKLLGVVIDRFLSWSTHTEALTKNLSSKIGVLRRVRSFLSYEASLKVLTLLFSPILITVVQFGPT